MEGHGRFRKFFFKGEGADVGLLGWVGNKGVLEWGNVPEEMPMDTEKVTSKINEVDSTVEDRFLKHELQMQLMAENMEGIMQMMAHKFQSQLKGIQKGAGYWSRVFRIVDFSCQVL